MSDRDMNLNPTGKGGFGDNPQNINRKGRPLNPYVEELREAIILVQTKKKTTLMEHCAERAFVNDDMAKTLLRKFAPDLQSTALTGADGESIKFQVEDAKDSED